MSVIKSIILGIVQGAAEFLPVSSSAHLVFGQHYLGFSSPQIFFNVLLHFATLMVVLVHFRKDIGKIIVNLHKVREIKTNEYCRTFWLIAAGSVPTVIIGYVFRRRIEEVFDSVVIVAVLLIVTGIVVFISDRIRETSKDEIKTTIIDVLIIGAAQGLAILPGISRSGMTIVTALFMGLNRRWAARFSFLLSVPVILGATILELTDSAVDFSAHLMMVYAAGMISAFIVGWISLKVLIKILENRMFSYFSYYCWFIAILVLIYC